MSTELIPHVYLTDRFFDAMSYATFWHKDAVRKSTNIAYISHPFGVAALVLEALGDEDQAIAGLLHDVAEDCGGEERLAEISERFGPLVAHIVRGCSDSLVVNEKEKAPWAHCAARCLRKKLKVFFTHKASQRVESATISSCL